LHSQIYLHGAALKHGKRVSLLGWNVKNQALYTVKPAYNGTAWNRLFSYSRTFPFNSDTWFGYYGLHVLKNVIFFL